MCVCVFFSLELRRNIPGIKILPYFFHVESASVSATINSMVGSAKPLRELLPCYKDYLGLGNRSVFYPYSSVIGNTFTFDVVQITGSNLTSNVSFTETLARAHL